MPNGTIKFFNAAKGFGFIVSDEGGKDIFLPAASVTSAGVSGLQAGQRVSFQAEPDKKGPKAIDLKVIAEVHAAKPVHPVIDRAANDQANLQLTVYIDPACDVCDDVLSELRDAGREPHVVDYMTSPPSKEQLRNLSILMRGSNHSLVKKYDPLFLELRLDDRFISDNEFWDTIIEHPFLINGPVVATASSAGVCNSRNAVKTFLATAFSGGPQASSKPKGLPERVLRLVSGDTPAPPVVNEPVVKKSAIEPPLPAMVEKAQEKPEVVPVQKAQAKAKTETKPKAPKVKAKPKPASSAKTKAAVKAKKPVRAVARKASRESGARK